MNMSTNMAFKTRTRFYSFDQYVRKCNDRLVVNMINKKLHCISGQSGIYCVTAAVWNILLTATARAGFTLCVARTRDHRREATLPMLVVVFFCWCCSPVLLLLWFGHTYAHKNCASDLWVEGIHTHHVEGRTKQPRLRSKQALTSTVSQ